MGEEPPLISSTFATLRAVRMPLILCCSSIPPSFPSLFRLGRGAEERGGIWGAPFCSCFASLRLHAARAWDLSFLFCCANVANQLQNLVRQIL